MKIADFDRSGTPIAMRYTLRIPRDVHTRLESIKQAVERAGGTMQIEESLAAHLTRQVGLMEKEMSKAFPSRDKSRGDEPRASRTSTPDQDDDPGIAG